MEIDRCGKKPKRVDAERERYIERECPRSSKSFKTTTTFFTRLLCRRFSREKEEEHPQSSWHHHHR